MIWRYALVLLMAAPLSGAGAENETVVHLSSTLPGEEVSFHGVVLVEGEPMRVLKGTTPFEWHPDGSLVFAAFEPTGAGSVLRLTLTSETPEPAVATGPRVMVGRRIGGVATEFVQPY